MLTETMDFPNTSEALAFRRVTGCGGYVVADEENGEVMLVPDRSSHGSRLTPSLLRYQPELRGRRVKIH